MESPVRSGAVSDRELAAFAPSIAAGSSVELPLRFISRSPVLRFSDLVLGRDGTLVTASDMMNYE
jgi:hypothetical protein